MLSKMANLRSLIIGAASLVLAATMLPQASTAAGGGSQIKAVVNGIVITSGDVAKRVNFLKIRRTPGNLQKLATEELVNEVLMRTEIIRTGNSVSTEDVDAAFQRFATNNKMSVAQLSSIMQQAGIGVDHFKGYIGVQMSWPKVVQMRYGGGSGRMTTEKFITRLKQDNGQKPVTTEYYLQQVIFVVPQSKRNSIMGKRKSEAEASRKHYPGCAQAKVFAATMRDVSIRDIGRILEPQLPDEWKDAIKKAPLGGTTTTRPTEKGIEYLAICKNRDVSDDFAAQIAYEARDLEKAEKEGESPDSKKYLDDLRSKAQIEIR
jgi:peptidyl-prolyl cis-trans isomerase SurA